MLNSKNKFLPLPGALVISTYAPCPDIRSVVTPDLKCPPSRPASSLLWVSLAPGMYRVGGSALSQVCMCVVLYILCMLVKPHASHIPRRATLPCAIDSSQASESHHRRLPLSPPPLPLSPTPNQWGPETPTVRDRTFDVYHAGYTCVNVNHLQDSGYTNETRDVANFWTKAVSNWKAFFLKKQST